MNNENEKLVAILDKAARNGWTCSLKTSKQCNQANTLIMLMTTKLYNRVTAEADAESEEEKPGAAGRKKSDETPINANDVMDSNAKNEEPLTEEAEDCWYSKENEELRQEQSCRCNYSVDEF